MLLDYCHGYMWWCFINNLHGFGLQCPWFVHPFWAGNGHPHLTWDGNAVKTPLLVWTRVFCSTHSSNGDCKRPSGSLNRVGLSNFRLHEFPVSLPISQSPLSAAAPKISEDFHWALRFAIHTKIAGFLPCCISCGNNVEANCRGTWASGYR